MTDEKKTFAQENKTAIIIIAAIAALVTVVYYQTHSFQFINFDDNVYVYENRAMTSGLSWDNIRGAFTSFYAANWHPLTWLSLMLDAQIFGITPGGFHVVNVVFHVVGTSLAFLVFQRMTGQVWQSAVIAALFAIHPAHVESVAWVTERKDVLSTIFWLLSMWFYIGWCRQGARPLKGLYLASLGAFAAGLMTKPAVISLPFVLILCDIWPLGRIDGRKAGEYSQILREKLPFFALAAASGIITVVAQRAGGATQTLEQVPLLSRVENSILSYAKYVYMAVWPKDLAVFYPYENDLPMNEVAIAAVLLISITALCIWQFDSRKYLLIGWLWFLGTLVPMIGIVKVGGQSMADRYTYVSYFGLFIMAVFGIAELARAFTVDKRIIAAVAIVVISAYSVLCYRQVSYWTDHETLYRHTLDRTKDNYMIAQNLCMHYFNQKRFEEAETMCEQSLSVKPNYAIARNSLGLIRFSQNDFAAAEREFAQALALEPSEVGIYSNLALAQVQQGKTEQAEANLQKASIMVNPQDPPVMFVACLRELAQTYYQNKDYNKAFESYARLLILSPSDVRSRGEMADSLFRIGRTDEAFAQMRSVVSSQPNDANYRNLIGSILLSLGRKDEAAEQFEAALRIDPDNSDAKSNLYRAKGGK